MGEDNHQRTDASRYRPARLATDALGNEVQTNHLVGVVNTEPPAVAEIDHASPRVAWDRLSSWSSSEQVRGSKPKRKRVLGWQLRLVIALLACGYLVLSTVWALSNPAPSGTDEAAHYIKALATGQGEFVGTHALFPYRDPTVPGVMYVWDQSTRAFRIPARQAPAATFQCDAGNAAVPATCVSGTRCQRWAAACVGDPPPTGEVVLPTYVGDYPPTLYVVPGLLSRLGNNDVNGLRLARMGGILVAFVLVTLAALLLIDRRSPALSLAGLVISVTPTTLYLNSVLNPNGGEIATSICFTAAMLRLWRDEGRVPAWVWLTAGLSGALLAFSRAFGPVWIVAPVGMTVLLLGSKPSLRAVRAAGWPALVGIALAAAGLAADLAWWHLVGVPRSLVSPLTFPRYLWLLVSNLPQIFEQQIGVLGWMDISIGAIPYIAWSVMVLAVVLLALLVARACQRAGLLLLIAGNLVFTVVVGSIMRITWDFPGGPGAIGRYFLPGSVVITLTAGEILRRNATRLHDLMPRNLLIYLVLGAGISHWMALWMAARRFAVGVGGNLFFLPYSQWSPHFGWVPWLALAGIGCLMIVASGVLARRARSTDAVPATAWQGDTRFASRNRVGGFHEK